MAENQLLIDLKNIRKTYVLGNQVVHALRNINLQIYRNDFIALMGPSGSGKSTLMNVIGCLDSPSEGTYLLNNREVSSMDDEELSELRNREIGFIFQTFNLLPRMSAVENVALPLVYTGLGRGERIAKAEEALRDVGLGDRMHHKPNELSGGQRQRVAIARALVNHPSLLLADEPTGNLDSVTSQDIMQLFDVLHRKGNTIILVTHEEDIAAHAKTTIKLIDGQIDSITQRQAD